MSTELVKIISDRLKDSNVSKISRETGITIQTLHNIKHDKVVPRKSTTEKLCIHFLGN